MENQFQPLFALRVQPNFDRPRCAELSRQLMETGFKKVRGVGVLSGTGQSDSRKVTGALEYLAARQAGMFGVEENILDDTGGLRPLPRWEEDVLLALSSVKREKKFVPLLSEQGQCVINCDKKYCEQLRTLQRYSLGKEWRAKREEILRNGSEVRDLFAPWPVQKVAAKYLREQNQEVGGDQLEKVDDTRRRTRGTRAGREKKRRAGFDK